MTIGSGETVLYAGRVYTVGEVRGDRVVLRRRGEPDRIAPVEQVGRPPRAASIYGGAA